MIRRPVTAMVVTAMLAAVVAQSAGAVSPSHVSTVSKSVVLVEAGDVLGTAFAEGAPGNYLTNAHVVAGHQQVVLTAPSGRIYAATVVAVDPTVDAARLHSTLELPALSAEMTPVQPGDSVFTVGSPDGLQGSVAAGIVAAVNRPEQDQLMSHPIDMIQVSMSINHGNSGGPLVASDGKVAGIVTAKVGGGEGIGFAVPIDTALSALGNVRAGSPAATSSPAASVGPDGAAGPASGSGNGASPVAVGVALAGLAGLALLLRHRTRRPTGLGAQAPTAATEPLVRFRREASGLSTEADVPIVIRRGSRRAEPDATSKPQSSEDKWT